MEESNVPFKPVPVIHLTVQPLRKVGEPTMSFDAFKSQVRDLLQTRCNYIIQKVEHLMIRDAIKSRVRGIYFVKRPSLKYALRTPP